MGTTAIDHIPEEWECSGGCRYEPKFDGFRATAIVNEHGGVSLSSRRLTRFNETFPEIALAVFDVLPPATVVDGEIVRWSRDGRLDFGALQRRQVAGGQRAVLALREPCHYVVFDVLEAGGEDLRSLPLSDRRRVLEQLLAAVPGTSLVVPCPQLTDRGEATLWFELLTVQGIEGLVVKAADDPYREGKRGWWKVRHRWTTEAIIGGVTDGIDAPRTLLLGRYSSSGRLRLVARSVALRRQIRAGFAGVLSPAGGGHPWPEMLPAGWAGGLSGAEEPIQYTRVEPTVVVEIAVDAAAEHGRWRHAARYVRLRTDLAPEDVPTGLDIE
ncbi:ATP-dependent DNA ligase [Actinomadura rubrisoli]|uniref:ATP-dependent DNA ligase n=1 Tax=Actinomadura rubrisoli TaxID=2530368 RepID=A0A4R5CJX8_9ACTN|nr:ATP-dependent DNA ligase [Actinomadura rubrisoli]TDD97714.1 ATP-dependent DNA ligase [Actinomadura rubrisoli]